MLPAHSFEDRVSSSEEGTETSQEMQIMLMAEVTEVLRRFQRRFCYMKAKWGLAFSEVDAGFNLVVQDLKKLQNSTKQAQAAMGNPNKI